MGKTSKKGGDGATSKGFLKWTEAMDDAFIDALLNQAHIGNRVDGVFTSTAYNKIVEELSGKFQIAIEKDHLKNRMKTLKAHFNACYDLFKSLSGFAWNPITKRFDADDEVWSALIESKPEAKKWMNTPINNYDRLFELFAKDRATGEGAETAREKIRRWAHEQSLGQFDPIEDLDQMVLDHEVSLETPDFTLPNDGNATHSEAPSSASEAPSSAKGKKRKKMEMTSLLEKQNDILEIGMEKLSSAIREGNEVIREGNYVLKEGNDVLREGNAIIERRLPCVVLANEVWNALLELDMDETALMDAYEFLNENEKRVRTFFGCPPNGRKQFLMRMMRN